MSRRFDDAFDAVIGEVYEAGADAVGWASVLGHLTELFGAAGTALHVGDTDCSGFGFGATHNFDPIALDLYAQHFYAINPLNPPLTRQPKNVVINAEALVPRHIYKRSEFFNDYGRRFGLEGSATAVLEKADGQIACLGIVQRLHAEPYGETELTFLRRLVPHLQRAIDLNRKLAGALAQRDELQAALDAMELGVAFLAADGQLLHANRSAEQLIRGGGGLHVRAKRLTASDIETNAHLQAIIASAARMTGGRGGTLAVPRPGRRPVLVRVSPYLAAGINASTRVIVFMRDPELSAAGTMAEAAAAYGLTRREAVIVEKLIGEANLSNIAGELEISEVTVRNHLARAMAKTATSKQAELVSLILSTRLPLRDRA